MGRLSIKSKSFKEYYQNKIDKKKLAAQELKEEQKKEFKRHQIEEIVRRYKSDWRSELDEAMTTSALMSITLPATGENINDTISMGSNDSFSPNDTNIPGNLWGIDTTYSTNHNQPNNVFPGFSDGDGVLYFSVPVTDTRGYGATVDYYSMTTKPIKLENDTVSFRAIAGNSTLIGRGMGSNGGSQPYRDLSVSWYSYENGVFQDFGTLGTISRFTNSNTQFEFKFPAHLIGKEVAINFYTDASTGANEAASFLEGFPIPWHPLGTLDERSFGDTSNTYAWFILNYDDIQGQGYAVDSKTTLALRLWQDLQAKYTSTSSWGRTVNDKTFDNPGAPAPISGSRYNFGLEHPETEQMIGMTQADLDYIVAWIQLNMMYLRGQTTTTYAITDLNFKRRTPANVFVALDDPEASAFIRDGSTDNLSRAEKKKKLEDHLKSGQEYLDKMFGEGMPKGATEISDYEPQQSFSHIAQALPYTDEDDAFDNDYYKGPPPDIDDDSDFPDLDIPLAKRKGDKIAGVPRNYPGEGAVPAYPSPRGPYTPIKNYGTDKNPKFMPSGPPINPYRLAKKKTVVAHHEPHGEVLSEKKRLKSPKNVVDKIPGYYDGKPAPLGFPIEEPPKMKNGYHPDLVDGKKVANRYNRLDPISAKAMPPTGNPHIDRKVRAVAKKSK